MLREGERLDDLEINGLKLIQNPQLYCFTSDSVLLANLTRVRKGEKVCDLCSGSGVVGILIASKKQPSYVALVELQARMADIAERNVKINGLGGRVEVFNVSVQQFGEERGNGAFDVVVCNPPYQPKNSGEVNVSPEVAICKTELKLSLDELTISASRLLKFGGKLFVIYKAERLAEIIFSLKQRNLEPKKLTFIKPRAEKPADTVIIEAVKGGKAGLKIDNVVVFTRDNNYTMQVKKLYAKE